jgi:hypothetical protein
MSAVANQEVLTPILLRSTTPGMPVTSCDVIVLTQLAFFCSSALGEGYVKCRSNLVNLAQAPV